MVVPRRTTFQNVGRSNPLHFILSLRSRRRREKQSLRGWDRRVSRYARFSRWHLMCHYESPPRGGEVILGTIKAITLTIPCRYPEGIATSLLRRDSRWQIGGVIAFMRRMESPLAFGFPPLTRGDVPRKRNRGDPISPPERNPSEKSRLMSPPATGGIKSSMI